MNIRLLFFIFLSVFFGFNALAYGINVITLAPNITNVLQAIITQAKKDHIKPDVHLLATVHYQGAPEAITKIPSIGNAFELNVEKMILLKPDLVIAWKGRTPQNILTALKAFNIRVIAVDAQSLNEVAALITQIGSAVHLKKSAAKLALDYLDQLRKLKPEHPRNQSVFVELSQMPLYTIGGKGFINEIVSFCGGKNIYQNINQESFMVSQESVIVKNPDIILITKGKRASSDHRAHSNHLMPIDAKIWLPYQQMTAVKEKQINVIRSDEISQATPDLIKGIKAVCHILNA